MEDVIGSTIDQADVQSGVSVSVNACRHKGQVDFVLDHVARHPK
jgi:hypothetical protein